VIRDALNANEAGVAFDHLLYMIVDTDLIVPATTLDLLVEAGQALGHDPATWARVKHAY
jgi:hypothetical protein